jgi:hypothetical protein
MHVLAGYPIILAAHVAVIVVCSGICGVDLVSLLAQWHTAAGAVDRVFPLSLTIAFRLLTLGNTFLDPTDALDLVEKFVQASLRGDVYIAIGVTQKPEQPTQELRQECDELQIGDGVQQGDPSNQKRPREGVESIDALFQQRYESLQGECGGQVSVTLRTFFVSGISIDNG